MVSMLSLVERGWGGARECSLKLQTMGIPVTHLIKGVLGDEVLGMIAPYPNIAIVDVPPLLFRLRFWCAVVAGTLSRRLRWILTDHPKTARELEWWCRWFRLTPVFIEERGGAVAFSVHGQPRSFQEIFS